MASGGRAQTNRRQASRLAVPVGANDHARGATEASVVLVEYGDYQCPRCAQAFTAVREVERWMRGQLRFVFRHFPLTDRHTYALAAAQAAEAAGAQGRFWEMHERLFARRRALSLSSLKRYAARLGLDVNRFARELAADAYRARVMADIEGGLRSGVTETPAFFINSVLHTGAWDLDTLMDRIMRAGEEEHLRRLTGARFIGDGKQR
jgi:protein-disulfide isomerase